MDPSDYRVIGVGCDVSSELSVQQALRRVMDHYGRIDSVVASAGESRAHMSSNIFSCYISFVIKIFHRNCGELLGI